MTATGPDAALRSVWSALQRGDAAQARAGCHAVLQQHPGIFDGWRMLAVAEQSLGNAAACREALSRAMALRPGDAATALDLGSVLLQEGEVEAARPLLQRAMAGLPKEPRAGFRYGTACFMAGDFAAAVEGFAVATGVDPQWVEAWNNLSAAHGQLKAYPQAIIAARRALALAPQSAPAHHALAALQSNLFDRESLDEGLAAARKALALDPRMAAAHHVAAILLRKLDEASAAESHARTALQLAPTEPQIIEALGDQLLLNRQPADAVEVYANAAGRGVNTPALRRQHGVALLHAGQHQLAILSFERLLREHPADQRAIAHLGVALAASGDPAAAAERIGLHRHVHARQLATPGGFGDAASFHSALAHDIRDHSQQRWEPAGLAARQAYLSGELLADRTPAILAFEQRLREAIDAFIVHCRAQAIEHPDDLFLRNVPRDGYRLHVWSTVAARAGFIDTHIHEESWLSGAYYVQLPPALGDESAGSHDGWIEFGRPFAGLPAWPEEQLRHERPQVGTLLLFPSYLFHRTLPYEGDGERISISFDLAAV